MTKIPGVPGIANGKQPPAGWKFRGTIIYANIYSGRLLDSFLCTADSQDAAGYMPEESRASPHT